MSRPRGRRTTQRHVVNDKHNPNWGYEEQLFELAGDMLDKLAPRPSNQVPLAGHNRRTK